MRSALAFVARHAKVVRSIDLAVRYNPVIRRQVQATIRRYRTGDTSQRAATAQALCRHIIAAGKLTRYGKGFDDDLAAWPILSKADLRADPRAFFVPGWLRVPTTTAGTTGMPLLLQRSVRSIAAEQVFLDELLAPHGLTWGRARVAILRSEIIKPIDDHAPPFAKETNRSRRLILSSPHLSMETLPWYLDRLAAFRPDVMFVYASLLANFLHLLIQSGRRLHVPIVVATSERLEPGLREAFQNQLGATVVDYYGMAERAAFAVCHGPQRWFFEPAYGVVELIPSPADPVTGNQRHVPIIGTGYWNEAQPLIRYDTGDRAIVPLSADAQELAAIARGEAPFLGLAGRTDEYIFAPDGRRIAALNVLPREVGHILQLQVIQDSTDHVTLRVLATPDFGRADRDRLMANARGKIPGSMRIEILVVDRLETLPNGKTPFVIRRDGCQQPSAIWDTAYAAPA